MTQEELLEQILPPLVEWEVQQLKASGKEFELDMIEFDPTEGCNCLYGQIFENSATEEALSFKMKNQIPSLFESWLEPELSISEDFNNNESALSIWMFIKWKQDEKQDVLDLLSTFVRWKNVTTESSIKNPFVIKIK